MCDERTWKCFVRRRGQEKEWEIRREEGGSVIGSAQDRMKLLTWLYSRAVERFFEVVSV